MEATGSASDYSLSFIAKLDLAEFTNSLKQVEDLIAGLANKGEGITIAPQADLTGINKIQEAINGLSSREIDLNVNPVGAVSGLDVVRESMAESIAEVERYRASLSAPLPPIRIQSDDSQVLSAEDQIANLKSNLSDLTGREYFIRINNGDTSAINAEIADIRANLSSLAGAGAEEVAAQGASTAAVNEATVAIEAQIGIIETLKEKILELKAAQTVNSNPINTAAINQSLQETEQELSRVQNVGKAGFDGMGNAINQTSGAVRAFGVNLASLTTGFVAFFAIQKIIDFVTEIGKIAPKVDGINQAFLALGLGGDAIERLRSASRGLVGDLDIEKQAVKFQELGLPVEKLGTFLAYAATQAQATGQSIDTLTDKLVTSLAGRGTRGFVQLGISAQQFQDELDKGGTRADALARIIQDRLGPDTSKVIVTLSDLTAKLSANFSNLLTNIGKGLSDFVSGTNSADVSALTTKLTASYKNFDTETKDQRTKTLTDLYQKEKDQMADLAKLEKARHDNNEDASVDPLTSSRRSNVLEDQIQKLSEQLIATKAVTAALKERNDTDSAKDVSKGSIDALKQELKDLSDQKNAIGGTDGQAQAQRDKITRQYNEIELQIKLLDGSKAQDVADERSKQREKDKAKAIEDRRKGVEELANVQQKLNDIERNAAVDNTDPVAQKISDINAQFADLTRQAKDAAKSQGQKADPALIARIDFDRVQAVQKVNLDEYNKNEKEADKIRTDNKRADDADYLKTRQKQYNDEQNAENQYGLDVSNQVFDKKLASYDSYANDLRAKIKESAAILNDPNIVNKDAELDNYKTLNSKLDEIDVQHNDKQKVLLAKNIVDNQDLNDQLLKIDQDFADKDLAINNSTLDEKAKAKLKDANKEAQQDAVLKAALTKPVVEKASISDIIDRSDRELQNIANSVRDIDPALAKMVETLGSITNLLSSIVNSFANNGVIGGTISLIIAGIEAVIKSIANISASSHAATEQIKIDQQKAIDGALEYNKILLAGQLVQAKADQDHLQSLRDQVAITKQQADASQAAVDADLAQLRTGYNIINEYKKFDLKNGKYFIHQDTVSNAGLSEDELTKLGAEGKLQNQDALYQKLLKDQADLTTARGNSAAAIQAENDALLGQTKNSLGQAILQGMESGVSSAQILTDAIRKSVLAGFDAKFIEPIAQDMYNQIAALGKDATDAQRAKVIESFKPQLDAAQKNLDALNSAFPSQVAGKASANSLAGGFTAITQQTADLLAGRFNALGITEIQQLDVQRLMLDQLVFLNGGKLPLIPGNLSPATAGLLGAVGQGAPSLSDQVANMKVQTAILTSIQLNTFNTAISTDSSDQSLKYIALNMVKAGAADLATQRTLRAGGLA